MSEDDKPAGGTATTQMRAVQKDLEVAKARQEIRAEYEAKLEAKEEEDRKKLSQSVYSQRERIKKLEDEMIAARQTLAILKWVGMTIGGLLASGVVAAMFGN